MYWKSIYYSTCYGLSDILKTSTGKAKFSCNTTTSCLMHTNVYVSMNVQMYDSTLYIVL